MEAVRLLGSLNSDTARLLELEPISIAQKYSMYSMASPQLSFKLRSRGSCARKQDIVRFQVQVTNQLRMPGLHSDPHGSTLQGFRMEHLEVSSTEAKGQILHSLAGNDWR